jgi:signal transduction histidine kinase
MSNKSSHSQTRGSGDRGLLIGLVVASYITIFASPPTDVTPRIALLVAAGLVYTLLGIYVAPRVQDTGLSLANIGYFGVELVLGGAIVYLSQGGGLLIILPLVAHAIESLPRGWKVVGCALCILAVEIPMSYVLTGAVGPDGEPAYPVFSAPFWEIMLPWSLQYLLAFAFVVIYTLAAVREKQARAEVERLAAELQQANRQLREYAAQVEELATVHERNRLAREIHDGLGHYLTGINMQIQAGRAVLDHDRDVALDALDQAQALAQEGLSEVRRSVAALRASPLDNQSLPQAIEGLVNECRAAGIATAYHVLGERIDLPPQVSLVLYRVAQEGMTNMIKYAQASSAEVTLDYRDEDQVSLTVRDSGVGTDDPSGGYGLIGVRERVQLLGGEVQIETAPGEGFSLKVQIPAESGNRPNNHA